ncbi:MAG: ABC transporter permease [Candidatus Aminicenantes bacterium]|nr:ABC transporter permease [Candidatus Aminicenantes bacterium]
MKKNTWFLIRELAWTDFKLRYNNSILGYIWSLLVPLMIFGVLYLVFSVFMRFEGIEHYQLYLLLGLILWSYFYEATNNGMQSMHYKASLISKMNFPKWVIIVASNMTSLFTLCLNLFVFAVFFMLSSATAKVTGWMVFFYLLQLIILSFAVSLFLASFYLRFRDLSHIWSIVLQVGFWLIPIVYPVSIIPDHLRPVFFLNPLARIIQDTRSVLIYGSSPPLRHTIISFVMIVFILIPGIVIFFIRSGKFAEEV